MTMITYGREAVRNEGLSMGSGLLGRVKTYLAKSSATGKTARGARRAHKRQLANVIIRHMWNDAKRAPTAPSTVAA